MTGVLLVDDEPLVLVGIQSMLKWEDYDAQVVGAARNGAQALELIDKLRPDLVIADIKMPVKWNQSTPSKMASQSKSEAEAS